MSCHDGLRASRYAVDTADVEAHPELFRCDVCHALLDGPVWVPAPYDCPNCGHSFAEPFCDLCGRDLFRSYSTGLARHHLAGERRASQGGEA